MGSHPLGIFVHPKRGKEQDKMGERNMGRKVGRKEERREGGMESRREGREWRSVLC